MSIYKIIGRLIGFSVFLIGLVLFWRTLQLFIANPRDIFTDIFTLGLGIILFITFLFAINLHNIQGEGIKPLAKFFKDPKQKLKRKIFVIIALMLILYNLMSTLLF